MFKDIWICYDYASYTITSMLSGLTSHKKCFTCNFVGTITQILSIAIAQLMILYVVAPVVIQKDITVMCIFVICCLDALLVLILFLMCTDTLESDSFKPIKIKIDGVLDFDEHKIIKIFGYDLGDSRIYCSKDFELRFINCLFGKAIFINEDMFKKMNCDDTACARIQEILNKEIRKHISQSNSILTDQKRSNMSSWR